VNRIGRRSRTVLMGVAVLAAFTIAVFVALTAANGLPGSSGTMVTADFSNINGLLAGNDVRIAGIRVGRVTHVDLTGGHAQVTFQLDDHRPVYRNATASIADQSALGEKYVQLVPGDASTPQLSGTDVLGLDRTAPAQDISDLLGVLDGPTRDALGSTVRQAGGGAANHASDMRDGISALPTALPDLATISRALTANSGADTTQLLQAANSLAASFAGRQQDLRALLGHLSTTLSAVDTNGGQPLASALTTAPGALANVRDALHNLQNPLADTRSAVTALAPGASALGAATPDVRGVLRDGVAPLDKLTGVADQAVPAVDALTTTFTDARPLAPLANQALTTASHPLAALAPYAPEISLFFTYFSDAMRFGDASGHWLRIYPPIDPQLVTGLLPIADPTVSKDTYPAPGVAGNEHQTALLGGLSGGGR
jgi:phospholipid/cholesterol/gamma-HCH transport system substrate-binding protein